VAAEETSIPDEKMREGRRMHDMIGSAGMLRGWIAMWTTHLLWLLAVLTVSVGAAAVTELLIGGRARRDQGRLAPLVPAAATDSRYPPLE
jgi:hypothetical protein